MLKKMTVILLFLFGFITVSGEEDLGLTLEKKDFSLIVNYIYLGNKYPVIMKEDNFYISLFEFFDKIGYHNYAVEDGILKMKLGDQAEEIQVDFNKLSTLNEFFSEEDDYYLEAGLFRKIFLESLEIDMEDFSIYMKTTPKIDAEIKKGLGYKELAIRSGETFSQLHYTNSRYLFDPGYMRFNFAKELSKNNSKGSHDWRGELEYQGPLLYGEITTTYDVRKEVVKGANLYYPNLAKGHILEVGGVYLDSGGWEKGIIFQKDKGYLEDGEIYIIRQNVPIGSRVELVYLGATIAVANEKNGVVIFENSEIKSDRIYELRIHTKDGKTYTRTTNTTKDFNQQGRKEYQYDVAVRENKAADMTFIKLGTFYGVTDNLTIGGNYFKVPESREGSYRYLERVKVESIYSNYYRNYPYTLMLGGDRVMNSDLFNRVNSVEGMGQIKINDFTFRYEGRYCSEYYDDKKSNELAFEYNSIIPLRANIYYQWLEKHDFSNENGLKMDLEYTKPFNRLLATLQYERRVNHEDRYGVNFYYTGYKNYSFKWNNSVSDRGDNIESLFSIYTRSGKNGIDYSADISYNQAEKEKLTFRMRIDYDNWLQLISNFSSRKNYDMTLGINRIVDLKNINRPLESMDSSRVKIVTFLDVNDNNIFDRGEETVGDIEVNIGSEKLITDVDGRAYLYGLPNNKVYSIQPVVRHPGYDTAKSSFSLKGKGRGEIEVEIPIKPLFGITGQIAVDPSLGDGSSFLRGTIVRISDENGNPIAATLLDGDGIYELKQLNTGRYKLEVGYLVNRSSQALVIPVEIIYEKGKGSLLRRDFKITEDGIYRN